MPSETYKSLRKDLFRFYSDQEFNETALRLFHYHYAENLVYRRFVQELNRPLPQHFSQIPHLPISAFKNHKVIISGLADEIVFQSSGTAGSVRSQHHVSDIALYKDSFREGFKRSYGDIKEYCILGLLPSYLERDDSSLIYMVDDFIQQSRYSESGFYLDELDLLYEALVQLKSEGRKTLLIGVTFGLLDFVDQYQLSFPDLIVMETGGMKGRRKEIIRTEVHDRLKAGFGVSAVHSEYGMTELLSQAYSQGDGLFTCPPWMRVSIRDIHDPMSHLNEGKSGGIDIVDLANLGSCPFIATDDLGRIQGDDKFEVLGRFDHSDIRGCSLLI